MAAEAAPLREEIERLTGRLEDLRVAGERMIDNALAEKQRAEAAEAKVLSLEAERDEERQHANEWLAQLHDAKRDALAAASRAREEQEKLGALRASLERWGIIQSHGDEEDGENDGRAYARCRCCGVIAWDGKPIHHKNKCEVGAALAPPAAESQENQQQLTGKGPK